VKKLVLLAASLAMLLMATTATLTLAQTEPGSKKDEVRCLAPEGCGPETIEEDELLCLIPEGCDTNGDGVPDLRAGDPAPGGETSTSAIQYDTTH
jgi:hypothetical protein